MQIGQLKEAFRQTKRSGWHPKRVPTKLLPARYSCFNDVIKWNHLSWSLPSIGACPWITNDPSLRQIHSSSPAKHRQQSTEGDEFVAQASCWSSCQEWLIYLARQSTSNSLMLLLHLKRTEKQYRWLSIENGARLGQRIKVRWLGWWLGRKNISVLRGTKGFE